MRPIHEREVHTAARRAAEGKLLRARRLAVQRPELVAYVAAVTDRLSVHAKAAAWLGLELSVEAMDAAVGEQRATIDEVLCVHERNADFADAIGACDPRMALRYLANTPALRQRSLICRVTSDVALTVPPEERGLVFLVLKTVVDILDGTGGGPPREFLH